MLIFDASIGWKSVDGIETIVVEILYEHGYLRGLVII